MSLGMTLRSTQRRAVRMLPGPSARVRPAWVEPCRIATIEAQPEAASASPSVLRLPLEALDGGELILLAIKPSVFSPLFKSARWLAVLTVLALGLLLSGTSPMGLSAERAAQLCFGAGLARLMLAVVSWSATWYVLTNRRVLEIHGVRAPRVTSTALVDIRNTYLSSGPHEKLLHLGTITFVTQHEDRTPWSWAHLQRAEDVHARIRRAIENALDLLPHV